MATANKGDALEATATLGAEVWNGSGRSAVSRLTGRKQKAKGPARTALLSEAKRLHLVEIWPLVLVQADQAAAGGGRGGGNVPAAGGSKRKRGASTR